MHHRRVQKGASSNLSSLPSFPLRCAVRQAVPHWRLRPARRFYRVPATESVTRAYLELSCTLAPLYG